MDAKELARATGDAINSFSFDYKDFCNEMQREHRTLQQSFTRLCFEWIKHCAEFKDYEFDGRNEASVMACKKLQEVIESEDIYLPLV